MFFTGTSTGTFLKGKLNGAKCQLRRKSNLYTDYVIDGAFRNDIPHGYIDRMTFPTKKNTKVNQYGDPISKKENEKKENKENKEKEEKQKNKANKTNKETSFVPEKGTVEYSGHYCDGVRNGLLRGHGGTEEKFNRWIFEGLYKDGHREGKYNVSLFLILDFLFIN